MFDSDARTIRQVLRGDRTRFNHLVDRHLPAVYAVALARTGHHPDAEDVTQQAFVTAFEKLGELREPQRFLAWLLTTARNEALKVAARRQREPAATENQIERGVSPDERTPEKKEMSELLWQSVEKLSPDHREVLTLHYAARKKVREIAGILGIAEPAVRKRLQRARETLGAKLLDEHADTFQPKRKPVDQASDIAKLLVTASAAGHAASAAGGTAAAAALNPWTLVGGGAAIAVVVSVPFLTGSEQPDTEEPAEQLVENVTPAPAPEPPAPPSLQTADSPSADAAQPVAPDATPAVEAATAANPASQHSFVSSFDDMPERTQEVLKGPVGIVFEDIYIADLLQFVEDMQELKFLVDDRAVLAPSLEQLNGLFAPDAVEPDERWQPRTVRYVTDGIFESVNMVEMPLLDAIGELAGAMGLEVLVEPSLLWISTPERVRALQRKPADVTGPPIPEEVLTKPARLLFEGVHQRDILAFVRDTYEINIVVDQSVVNPVVQNVQIGGDLRIRGSRGLFAGTRTGFVSPQTETLRNDDSLLESRTDPLPPGVVTDGKVRYISLRDVLVWDALQVLARPFGLAYALRLPDRILIVSTPDRIAADDLPVEHLVTPDEASERLSNISLLRTSHLRPHLAQGITAETIDEARHIQIGVLAIDASDPEGPRAILRVRRDHIARLGEGESHQDLSVRKIDPDVNRVTLYSSKYDHEYELDAPDLEPDAVALHSKMWMAPAFRVAEIREVDGEPMVEIEFSSGTRLYRTGDSFEEITVHRIDTRRRTVSLSISDGETIMVSDIRRGDRKPGPVELGRTTPN